MARFKMAWWLLCGAFVLATFGCVTPRVQSNTPRTAMEQLLMTTAVQRGLAELTLPLVSGSVVSLEAIGLTIPSHTSINTDVSFIRWAVAGRLGQMGFRMQRGDEPAGYLVRIMVQTFGTESGVVFFDMPPVQSVLIPFALPELTLYKKEMQSAHVRFWIDLYDFATGEHLRSTPWYLGTLYYNQYTMLFFISFFATDLVLPP